MLPGKWVYIWQVAKVCRAGVPAVIQELKRAGVAGVAVKGHNGYSTRDWDVPVLEELREACRDNGIGFALWGYVYLNLPVQEAQAAGRMIEKHKPDFYLIDAEAHAKGKWAAAPIFAQALKKLANGTPLGLNSYRFPSYHRELPWKALRAVCDFDCPQVYWRGGSVDGNLTKSMDEFEAFTPKLPYWPAGDMYYEFGIKPTPAQVTRFLTLCKDDPDIAGCIFWSMDQKNVVPELWQAMADFPWSVSGAEIGPPLPPEPPEIIMFNAVLTGNVWLRRGPGTTYAKIKGLVKGTRVNVIRIVGNWCELDEGWITAQYVKRL